MESILWIKVWSFGIDSFLIKSTTLSSLVIKQNVCPVTQNTKKSDETFSRDHFFEIIMANIIETYAFSITLVDNRRF